MSRYQPPENWHVRPIWQAFYRRLFAFYGPWRAREIILGWDEQANADLDAWDRLGER